MMNRDPKTQTEFCANIEKDCTSYNGAIPYHRRAVIEGSVVFRIGTETQTYFEGRADDKAGTINWERLSGASRGTGAITSRWHRIAGSWSIQFSDSSLLSEGERITVTYDWQPHHLSGAEVMVRVNNEERFIPIEELQSALYNYLGE